MFMTFNQTTAASLNTPTAKEALVYIELAVQHLSTAASKISSSNDALGSPEVNDDVNAAFDMIVELQDLIEGEG